MSRAFNQRALHYNNCSFQSIFMITRKFCIFQKLTIISIELHLGLCLCLVTSLGLRNGHLLEKLNETSNSIQCLITILIINSSIN
jgi:hypothetical protein